MAFRRLRGRSWLFEPGKTFDSQPEQRWVELIFPVKDPRGNDVRFLQFVHERPLHLFILAEDLGDFDHVHPEQVLGTSYNVTHVFPHGGRYRLYADYTPPGSAKVVEQLPLNVLGKARPRGRLKPDQLLAKVADGLRATLTLDRPLWAGEHLQITCLVTIASTGLPAGKPTTRAGRKQVK